jgi:hypothetical protein
MSWRLLGEYNAREHWSVYLLATAANLFLSIPLYIAARAGILAQLPLTGSTSQFISAYGVNWGIVLDFLWTTLIFQGILAVLVVTVAATTLLQKGWRWLYIFSAFIVSGFVGYWLGARFLQTLSWVSLLQNSGIDSSGVYSDLFWYGLGATVFYVAMMLVLRRSYNRLVTSRNPLVLSATEGSQQPELGS